MGSWTVGMGSWAEGVGSWTVGMGSWAEGVGSWTVGMGSWAEGVGSWTVGMGSWTEGMGSWTEGMGSSPHHTSSTCSATFSRHCSFWVMPHPTMNPITQYVWTVWNSIGLRGDFILQNWVPPYMGLECS